MQILCMYELVQGDLSFNSPGIEWSSLGSLASIEPVGMMIGHGLR